ncbi:MAG: glycosyltransferase [Bacilli bacterium]|jgi:lipopolysaccharide biosynthesis glycosyltransferase
MVISLCCTKNWYYYLLVNIYALLSTNKVKKLYLIIEDNTITSIKDICSKYKAEVEFININKIDEYVKQSSPNYNTKYSKLSMSRLYFTQILKEDKILYLDADTLVLDDISELWNTKFDDNVLIGIHEGGEWDRHLHTTGLDSKYINSGVLLMNLKALREEELGESMLYLINNNKYDFPDQDVINLVCRNRIGYISNEYNSAETTGIPEHIRIMHYIRGNKGWKKDSKHSELWREWEEKLIDNGFVEEIKVKAIESFTYQYFDEIKNTLIRQNNYQNAEGLINVGDIFIVKKEKYKYLTGNNNQKKTVVEPI